MKRLINISVQKRWVLVALFLMLALFGYFSWKQLAVEAYPDIADVTSQVVTQIPGLAAEEVEQQITIPVERALNGLPGMHVMRSKSTFGLSMITIVFQDGVEDYWARMRIQERLAEINLPYDAQPELDPLTSPIGEIFRYIIESDGEEDLRQLTDLQNFTIIPRIKQVSGVADVTNFGGITTQFQVELNPAKLEQYQLSLNEVIETIESNHVNAGGSVLPRGDLGYVVRGIGLVKNLEDLGRIVVKSEEGVPIYLNDLGTLQYGTLERKGVLGYSDRERSYSESIEGIVLLLKGQNPSDVLAGIHEAVRELNEETLPEGVRIHPFLDRTVLVDTTLDTVSYTLLEGMALVILVLIVFLGSWRGALLVMITIPLALLIAFILMHLTDIPANLLSLGAIDFGIIVDGAIVMMETILKKREDAPKDRLRTGTVVDLAASVAKPIFFATLIIIVAYLPLFAFERVEKKLFTPMAYTVGYALLGALAVALLLIPGLAYMIYRRPQRIYHNKWLARLTELYQCRIAFIVARPKLLLWPLLLILGGTAILTARVGKDFLPPLDEGSLWLQVQLPPGISVEKSRELSDSLRARTLKYPEVDYIMVQAGRNDDGTDPWTASHFEVSVGLKPYKEWTGKRNKEDLIADLSQEYQNLPSMTVGFSQPMIDGVMDKISGAHSELVVKIYGDDFRETRRVAEEVSGVLETIPGAVDLAIDQEPPLPQLQIIAQRDLIAQYGLNVSDVAELIEVAIGGKAVSQLYVGHKVYDIICRYDEGSRNTPEKIGNLMLTSQTGAKIPLSQVAEIRTSTGESNITREMNKRHLTVKLNVRDRDLQSLLKEAQQAIASEVRFDKDAIHIKWGGQFENQHRAYARLGLIVPLALGLMFILLYAAFASFRQAALLMSIVPLALFGGMLALNIRGMSLNVSSAVGFIALFGVAIQNGVILISHINHLRSEGYPLRRAVVQGSQQRFRPVLMTATVAILGLSPASMATGIGSDVQRPLATVIVYGLLFSTVITLFILPAMYYVLERGLSKVRPTQVALSVLFTGITLSTFAQPLDTNFRKLETGHLHFMGMVGASNVGYAAERYHVQIAEAELERAGILPDPELGLTWFDNGERRRQMGYGFESELGWTLELNGKRKARINLAQNLLALRSLLLVDYFRDLRAESTLAFLEGLQQRLLLDVQVDSYQNLRRLATSDSIRFRLGSISEVDAQQSRLEAGLLYNEVLSQEVDWRSSLLALNQLSGRGSSDTLLVPVGDMRRFERSFSLDDLLTEALNQRSDLQVALQDRKVAAATVKLVRASRAPDLGVSLGYDYATVIRNELAETPAFGSVRVGVSVPIPFSNVRKGDIRAAEYASSQADLLYREVELAIQAEVTRWYFAYEASRRQVAQYDGGLLTDSRTILAGKVYSYERGETSLLEVLNAQRTYNEVQQGYLQTVFDAASALVELERAVGMWDIEF